MGSITDAENERRMYGDDPAYRETVLAWLNANGIKGSYVPILERGSIADGKLSVRVFTGNRLVKADDGTEERESAVFTVPVKVQPTGLVAEWLRKGGR